MTSDQNTSTIIDLTIPANLRFSAGVREIISEFCDHNQFDNIVRNQLKLIIDELFMNAVRYGSGKNSKVIVRISYTNQILEGTVEDFGEGSKKIDVEELKKIILTQTNNNILTKTSGRGLAQIVQKWTDSVKIQNNNTGGIRIIFQKKIIPKPSSEKETITTEALLEVKPNQLSEYVFLFEGEITADNIKQYQQKVNQFLDTNKNATSIILDFEKLKYCNSTFIGQIADWYNRMSKNNGKMIICNPNEEILNIIDMVGLTQIIPIQQLNKQKL